VFCCCPEPPIVIPKERSDEGSAIVYYDGTMCVFVFIRGNNNHARTRIFTHKDTTISRNTQVFFESCQQKGVCFQFHPPQSPLKIRLLFLIIIFCINLQKKL